MGIEATTNSESTKAALESLDSQLKRAYTIIRDQIIKNLRSIELRSAAATESIVSEIEKSTAQNDRNQAHAIQLVKKIADATGTSTNASFSWNELKLIDLDDVGEEIQEETMSPRKRSRASPLKSFHFFFLN
ncbi:hypothetical protein NE237_006072 [Protea cynaroides]|uniref:Uncharacterized protein n=1 Tax=Protea cynaroides TaxID=273540 RepID=A0A9Q0QUY8_9MAGN|nr:hypothetical protein NE237_006072 [Protea cynaroides]